MIAGFKTWTTNIYNKVRRVNELVRTPENSGLTLRQQETGRKALKILGIEETEGLNKQELVIFLYAVGLNPTDDVIDSKLRAFKLHDLDRFTFGHVCHIWQSMLQDLTDEEEILRRAFQFFDKDGNGEISIPELRTTMHELGDLLSEEEILAFMAVMDVNNDGVIGFEEFIGTLKTQTPELIQAESVESPTNGLGPAASGEANGQDDGDMRYAAADEKPKYANGVTVTAVAAAPEPHKQQHTSIDMASVLARPASGAAAAAAATVAAAPALPQQHQQPQEPERTSGTPPQSRPQAVAESVSEPFIYSPERRSEFYMHGDISASAALDAGRRHVSGPYDEPRYLEDQQHQGSGARLDRLRPQGVVYIPTASPHKSRAAAQQTARVQPTLLGHSN